MADDAPVALFDGPCNFCDGAVHFVIDRERGSTLKFAALQSEEGGALLDRTSTAQQAQRLREGASGAGDPDTMVLVEVDRPYTHSTADAPRRSSPPPVAWAASHAAFVELGTAERASRCAHALRAHATEPTSAIALVLLDDDFTLVPGPEGVELRAAANRLGQAMAASGIHDTKDLEAFARTPAPERVAPWLVISKSQVVVIPRLSALAQPLPIEGEPDCRSVPPR